VGVTVRPCAGCGAGLPYSGVGRPAERCPACNRAARAGRKRAYYQRPEVKEKKRAYHEKKMAAQRARREANRANPQGIKCATCDEHLAHPTPDGLCGWCRMGIPA
jgi:hypothetical protein